MSHSISSGRHHAISIAVGVSLSLGISSSAFADIIPPKVYATTPGGINIADGSLQYSATDLSVGTLSLVRSHRTGSTNAQSSEPPFGKHFSSNFHSYVSISAKTSGQNPRLPNVHLGSGASGMYARYIGTNTVFPNNQDAEKGILSYNGTTYTFIDGSDGSGTIYTFHSSLQAPGVQWASESRMLERIDFPDGRRQTYS